MTDDDYWIDITSIVDHVHGYRVEMNTMTTKYRHRTVGSDTIPYWKEGAPPLEAFES